MTFEKGKQKTGGRKKGTPNQTTAMVKTAIEEAFIELGGKDYMIELAKSDPRAFCGLLARLLPAEIKSTALNNIAHDAVTQINFNPVGVDKPKTHIEWLEELS